MKAKGLMCLMAAVILLATAGVACAADEAGTTTTFGAGTATTNENYSTIVGYNAGNGDTSSGDSNTFIGSYTGDSNTTGRNNTFFGYGTGQYNTTGQNNTFIGRGAGNLSQLGSNNVFIGFGAGLSQTGSNRLIIDNCLNDGGCDSPFIYGEFDNRLLKVDGSLGLGTIPVRQLHIAGSNAVFRMDRSEDTAAFILVRTDPGGAPLKTFVVGTNASGANTGEFIINDLGTAVGGPGTRRMTIWSSGVVEFSGPVQAQSFTEMSSLAFKTNVRTYENALDTVNRLRGVRFDWKESGTPSVGLIAEEVEGVVPEIVAHGGKNGAATGVNYSALIGVLVEAIKEQQTELDNLKALKGVVQQQESVMFEYREALTRQQEAISQLMAEINRLKSRDMIAQK